MLPVETFCPALQPMAVLRVAFVASVPSRSRRHQKPMPTLQVPCKPRSPVCCPINVLHQPSVNDCPVDPPTRIFSQPVVSTAPGWRLFAVLPKLLIGPTATLFARRARRCRSRGRTDCRRHRARQRDFGACIPPRGIVRSSEVLRFK